MVYCIAIADKRYTLYYSEIRVIYFDEVSDRKNLRENEENEESVSMSPFFLSFDF